MSNCCMRRPAKFHVDSAVRFWAIVNIREEGRQTPPPPVKRGLRRQWNTCQPEMNLIAVSARLQVIASFWKNTINFDKMAPEMQRQCPQHRIRISIISPIFQLALISRSEKRPFLRCLPYWSTLAVATVTSRPQSCHELWLPLPHTAQNGSDTIVLTIILPPTSKYKPLPLWTMDNRMLAISH